MTKIDLDLWQRMSDSSKAFVNHFINSNELPATTIEMEDTPSGLRVLYYLTDDDGRMTIRSGQPVTESMLVPDLELPWRDPE